MLWQVSARAASCVQLSQVVWKKGVLSESTQDAGRGNSLLGGRWDVIDLNLPVGTVAIIRH